MLKEDTISISDGETKQIDAIFSQKELVEDNNVTITVSAEISSEGNIGLGTDSVKTDNGIIRMVILPQNSGSQIVSPINITIDGILILAIIAFFIFISSVIGGVIPFLGKWEKESLAKFTVFGGGVILSLSLFNILPGSIGIGGAFAVVGFLLGITLLFGIEKLMSASKHKDIGLATMVIGFNINEIVEGVLLALAVLILTRSGTLAVWALVVMSLHSMPAAFSYISYIRYKNVTGRRTLIYFLLLILSLPVGIIIGIMILKTVPMALIGFIFRLTAGMLLTLSLTEMSPLVWKKQKFLTSATPYYMAGMGFMGALLIFL
jgi:zinc transporter ZupT